MHNPPTGRSVIRPTYLREVRMRTLLELRILAGYVLADLADAIVIRLDSFTVREYLRRDKPVPVDVLRRLGRAHRRRSDRNDRYFVTYKTTR